MPPDTAPTKAAPSTLTVLFQLARWARPAAPRLVLGGVSALLASLLALVIPQVLGALVNGPLLSAGSRSSVIGAAALVLALGLAEAFLIWCRRVFIATPATSVEHTMRTELFNRLLDLPAAFHDRWSGGQLLSRMMGDLSSIRRWFAFGLVMLIVSTVTIIVGMVMLLTSSWELGLIYVAGAVPMVWLAFSFRADYAVAARRARDQAGDLASTVEESVHGIRVLKAFGRGDDAHADFVRQADELRTTEVHKARTLARVSFALTAIPESVLALCLGVGAWLVVRGDLSLGGLVAFFATAAVVNRPVEALSHLLAMTLDARAATDRYLEVRDRVDTLHDPDSPLSVPPATPGGARVEFRDVVVSFDGTRVLDGVTLSLLPGKTTAIVGLTGSGKTTMLALVPRLLDVSAGSIEIDGVDVRSLTRFDVRSLVAPAFEDPVLFSASVRENVLLGVLGAADEAAGTHRYEAALDEALTAAQARFAYQLPQGLETMVGEAGMSLSGGQRQRLALARAIATAPRVLVLDDPLSAVDVATEAAATDALRELLPGTTTLVVAHRPSTVALADQVAVLEGGKITATGTHSELLASNAHYRYVLTAMETEHPLPASIEAEEVNR